MICSSQLYFQQYMSSKSVEHEQLFDLLQKMMEYDASKRITLEEAIKHPFFTPLKKASENWTPGHRFLLFSHGDSCWLYQSALLMQ